ncbi:MAG: LysR family transcriptional regulator [Clostridia bacterium]|nr:LysR family transcriptional regulator [Clostridia bacterium]
MNENQIDTFLAVVQHGSFSRAAQSLYISQPAVTYRIHSLEEELGAKLFDCGAFAAELTPAGQAFYNEAKYMSDMFFMARRRMLAFAPQSTITLGFPEMMLRDGRAFLQIMDACTQALGGEDGKLVVSQKLERAPLHVQQLIRGEVDLIFADLGLEELGGERFERRRLFGEQSRVCMHKEHPLAQKKSLRLSDLEKQTVYLYEDDTSFIMRVCQQLGSRGIVPETQRFPSLMQLLPTLLKKSGVTITNDRPIVHEELIYLPLDMEKNIDIGIAWMKDRITPRLRQAVHIIENMPWEAWTNTENG